MSIGIRDFASLLVKDGTDLSLFAMMKISSFQRASG